MHRDAGPQPTAAHREVREQETASNSMFPPGLLAAEPEATSERRDQFVAQALGERRASVYFFDATFSVPKSVSLLHASLQVKAQQARQQGREAEAEDWDRRAQVVWVAIMAANQAMLDYLQRGRVQPGRLSLGALGGGSRTRMSG
jgi:hypothetical protein